jgi:nitrate/TMAO reductase-like tetraheme cytochrome c subunit
MSMLMRGIASAAGVFLALAALPAPDEKPWELAPPAPAIRLRPEKLEQLEGEKCGTCHADVREEWLSTAHAISWKDEAYREALKEKSRPQTCHGCHTPKPLLPATLVARAEARSELQDLGIDCTSCHSASDGAVLGPAGRPSSAHTARASDYMTEKNSSALCSVCHATNIGPVVGIAKDYETSKQAERGRSCIGCHMQVVERKPAQGAPEGAAAYKGRSHAIQTPRDPAFLARAFELKLAVDGKRSVVTIRNLAGHRVPGLIGREVQFQAEVLDAQGKKLASGEVVFDAQRYLPVDQSADITLGAVGQKVRVVGLHRDPRADAPVRFLERELAPGH